MNLARRVTSFGDFRSHCRIITNGADRLQIVRLAKDESRYDFQPPLRAVRLARALTSLWQGRSAPEKIHMIRTILLLAGLIGLSACTSAGSPPGSAAATAPAEAVDQAAVDAFAQTYTFGVPGGVPNECRVTLAATPILRTPEHVTRPVQINAACRQNFRSLSAVTRWSPTGGASIALFGGEPVRELADFSPAQDGTGVYLRGGFQGDANIYELRAPDA